MAENSDAMPIDKVFTDLKRNGLVHKGRILVRKKASWSHNFKAGIIRTKRIYYNESLSSMDEDALTFAILHEESHLTTPQNSTILIGFMIFSCSLLTYVYLTMRGQGHSDGLALNLSTVILLIVSIMSLRVFETPLQEDETRADEGAARTMFMKLGIKNPSVIIASFFRTIREQQGDRDSLAIRTVRFFFGGVHPPDNERVAAIEMLERALERENTGK